MKTIDIISPVRPEGAAGTASAEGMVVFYPLWLFESKLFVKPLFGAEKERRLIVLIDAIDGVAYLYQQVPPPSQGQVEARRVLEAGVDEAKAALSAEKKLQTYAMAKYRGFSPTRLELSPGRLVHKVFHVQPADRNGNAASVLDGLTGRMTEIG